MNAWSIVLQSSAILLREGLEALLVVAALAAFLRRAGAGDRLPLLYSGAIAAIVASLAAAY
ncbi:FTR1 family protein, partial [Stenotrophomonas maltophilia]|uniref:FTR1 family protein n=1 Tax=Stenotrophomonas maltophilia TaxID=40324 RepID=UPI0019531DDB